LFISALACPLPSIPSASLSDLPVDKKVLYDTSITLTCNHGYRLNDGRNTTTLSCQANQTFNWTDSCEGYTIFKAYSFSLFV